MSAPTVDPEPTVDSVPPTGSEPSVDVMIPAYGDGPMLREAVASVLAQTDPRWWLTVVDDGPADPGLAAWFESLGHERVRYLHNPANLGINRNFQRCVDLSNRELVVLLGADDRLLPGYVSAVLSAAAAFPQAAMIQPGVLAIDEAGRPSRPLADRVKSVLAMRVAGRRLVGGEQLAASLLRANWMYFPAVSFRRHWIARFGFREGYDVVLDLDLYLRMLLEGATLVLVEETCFEYRRHTASLSSTEAATGGRFREELSFFVDARGLALAHGWDRAARAADVHLTSRLHALSRSVSAVRGGNLAAARALAVSAADLRGRTLRGRGAQDAATR